MFLIDSFQRKLLFKFRKCQKKLDFYMIGNKKQIAGQRFFPFTKCILLYDKSKFMYNLFATPGYDNYEMLYIVLQEM